MGAFNCLPVVNPPRIVIPFQLPIDLSPRPFAPLLFCNTLRNYQQVRNGAAQLLFLLRFVSVDKTRPHALEAVVLHSKVSEIPNSRARTKLNARPRHLFSPGPSRIPFYVSFLSYNISHFSSVLIYLRLPPPPAAAADAPLAHVSKRIFRHGSFPVNKNASRRYIHAHTHGGPRALNVEKIGSIIQDEMNICVTPYGR
jgi:hypothetical protein